MFILWDDVIFIRKNIVVWFMVLILLYLLEEVWLEDSLCWENKF